jgi:murein DD-endopeptidase MepM/ murein hydrolase activator NlpD
MRRARSILIVAILLIGVIAAAATPAKSTPRWSLRYQPTRIVNGAPALLRVTTPGRPRTLTAKWLDHEIPFTLDPSQKGNAWIALAGVSLETKPGIYPIELHAAMDTGPVVTYKQGIRVQKQRYPKVVVLKVPGRFTAPDPEQLRVIEREKQIKADAFKVLTPEREWKGSFERPVTAEISDVFGVQRVFNGAVQSTHQGLDFRVPTGTEVSAINSGTVILARFLYFEGNCVVIDHGQGLLTLYLHLSEFRVKEGDRVTKGQPIGLSGGTGRATGPHLHLAVRWQGIYLNPEGLLALRLPN